MRRGSALQSAAVGSSVLPPPPEGRPRSTLRQAPPELLLRGCPCPRRADLLGQRFGGRTRRAHEYLLERKEIQQLASGRTHTRGHASVSAELQVCEHPSNSVLTPPPAQLHTPRCTDTCTYVYTHTCIVHGQMDIYMGYISSHMLAHIHTHTRVWVGAHARVGAVPGPIQGLWEAAPAAWGSEKTNGEGGWGELLGLGVSTHSCCGGLFYNHSKNIIQDEGESRLLQASAGPSQGIYHSELGAPPATPW